MRKSSPATVPRRTPVSSSPRTRVSTPRYNQDSVDEPTGSSNSNTDSDHKAERRRSAGGTGKGENVHVAVRFRPLSGPEKARGETEQWEPIDDKYVGVVTDSATRSVAKYAFDAVFSAQTSTMDVFKRVAHDLVWSSMDGVNSTVFAYGVTSSGKTYTMRGKKNEPGIIPLSIEQVFKAIQSTPDREFLLRVAYLEIYNEVINDLLDPSRTNLKLREGVAEGVYVEGLKEEVVVSITHVISLIAAGEAHRHVGATSLNTESSRSHTIFRLHIESTPRMGGTDVRASNLNLIDLAGSENSKAYGASNGSSRSAEAESGVKLHAGTRQREGGFINKSLLTLGTVITKLSEGSAGHIPYRDSKLTRYLQNSLGGNGRISMICTITPASNSSEETHNTLKFASRAKYIEVKADTNRIMDEKSLIKKYRQEIQALRQQLEDVTRQQHSNPASPRISTPPSEPASSPASSSTNSSWEHDKAVLEGRIARLKRIILHSSRIGSMNLPDSTPRSKTTSRLFDNGISTTFATPSPSSIMTPDRLNSTNGDRIAGSAGSLSTPIAGDSTPQSMKQPKRYPPGGHLPAAWTSRSGAEATTMDARGANAESQYHDALEQCRQASGVLELPSAAGEVFTGLAGLQATNRQAGGQARYISAEEEAKLEEEMQEEMRLLVAEAEAKAAELDNVTNDFRQKEAQSNESIQKLKGELTSKTREMTVLERKMVELTKRGAGSEELTKLITQLRKDNGEKNFELQVALADNKLMQDTIDMMQQENAQLSMQVETLMNAIEPQQLQSHIDAKANQTKKKPSEGSPPREGITVEEAMQTLQHGFKLLKGCSDFVTENKVSELEDAHLEALIELRTMKERLRQRQQQAASPGSSPEAVSSMYIPRKN